MDPIASLGHRIRWRIVFGRCGFFFDPIGKLEDQIWWKVVLGCQGTHSDPIASLADRILEYYLGVEGFFLSDS